MNASMSNPSLSRLLAGKIEGLKRELVDSQPIIK